jgi:putative membrane protein
MWMTRGWGYFGPWMWVGGLVWILLLVAAGLLIYSLVRRWQPSAARPDDPLTVLQVRYARGEITREQFMQMRADLTGRDP